MQLPPIVEATASAAATDGCQVIGCCHRQMMIEGFGRQMIEGLGRQMIEELDRQVIGCHRQVIGCHRQTMFEGLGLPEASVVEMAMTSKSDPASLRAAAVAVGEAEY